MKEPAAYGIPVTVTCRVLKLARQAYCRWLGHPVTGTDTGLGETHRANALFDAHRDDPEFGYRFLADEPAVPRLPWQTGPRGGPPPAATWAVAHWFQTWLGCVPPPCRGERRG